MADLGKTGITAVRTVSLPVSDPDRARDFYVGTLGFEVRVDAQFNGGQRWIEVAPPGGQTTVALAPPGGVSPGIDSGIRLATQDAAVDHAGLAERGVDVDPELQRWPGVPPMFSLRDPDGNTLYVVESTS